MRCGGSSRNSGDGGVSEDEDPESIVGLALSLPPRCAIVHVYHPEAEAELINLRFHLSFSSVGDFICPSMESPTPRMRFQRSPGEKSQFH